MKNKKWNGDLTITLTLGELRELEMQKAKVDSLIDIIASSHMHQYDNVCDRMKDFVEVTDKYVLDKLNEELDKKFE